jgi:hypothetical protein
MRKVRVNWLQRKLANDKMARLHKCIEKQPKNCQFEKMKDWQEFESINEARKEAERRNTPLKLCAQCFKG